jgi:hypothetical protein
MSWGQVDLNPQSERTKFALSAIIINSQVRKAGLPPLAAIRFMQSQSGRKQPFPT